jgi:hypothetical protein
MKIETKFNVGQEVWYIHIYNTKPKTSIFMNYEITEIRITLDDNKKLKVWYEITEDEWSTDKNLFPTRAAALAEIERRKAK